MILFMVANDQGYRPESYDIPFLYEGLGRPDITENNIQLVSWNEVTYQLQAGSREVISIQTISDLKKAVFDAAQKDTLCRDINCQFASQYGVDIFKVYASAENEYKKIIDHVFESWPHPVIGNLLVSAGIRPQTSYTQYLRNWDSFPDKYMKLDTKKKIKAVILHPESVGLAQLESSGRDQVRVSKDMTELARAVMGEISTYATKKLEKIYALELCSSEKLLEAQRQLIRDIISVRFYDEKGRQLELREWFLSLKTDKPIKAAEYLFFYFPNLADLTKGMQWTAFVKLIELSLEGKSGLKYEEPDLALKNIWQACEDLFKKMPPVIRCAIIISGIKRLEKSKQLPRYSMSVPKNYDFGNSSEYLLGIEQVTEASGRRFVPTLQQIDSRGILLWNWSRDEKHIATMTYRHYLLPLWAGPSGHAAGILEFYIRHLCGSIIQIEHETETEAIYIASIILPTMFAFWRLYYDKRISAVHTLAETYEAAYAGGLHENEKLSPETRDYINSYIQFEELFLDKPEDMAYHDPFETVTYYPREIKILDGIVNPVRIMEQIKCKHYKSLQDLDKTIDMLRAELTRKGYDVPQWSKPIVKKTSAIQYQKLLSGLVVRDFNLLNVHTYPKPPTSAALRSVVRLEQPSALAALYEKILPLSCYHFLEDFTNLPMYMTREKMIPFLSAVAFSDIRSCMLKEDILTFLAVVQTDAEFWTGIKALIPLRGTEDMACSVTDTGYGLAFSGKIDVGMDYKITDKLSIHFKQVILNSGLNEYADIPHILFLSEIAGGDLALELAVTLSSGGQAMYIEGTYADGKVLTVAKLLSLFGLDTVIPVSSLLPDDESIFGSLGLRGISMTVLKNPDSITQIGFTIAAEKPWDLFDGKITLQPYFEMNLEYPFDSQYRQVDYLVLGRWEIGESIFDLMYRSDKMILAQLAQGSVLDFAKIAESFAKGVEFPEIKLTGMELTANLASKDYTLFLSAEDVLKFHVGGKELEISELAFQLDFWNGSFGDLELSAQIDLGVIILQLAGIYSADAGFVFEAIADTQAAGRNGLTFGEIAEAFGMDAGSLPKFLRDFAIMQIGFTGNITNKDFTLAVSTSAGIISAEIAAGADWKFSYLLPESSGIHMMDMPLAGDMVKKILPEADDFGVNGFCMGVSKADGLVLKCIAFGMACQVDFKKSQPKPKSGEMLLASADSNAGLTVKWLEIKKTFAVLSIDKIGVGMDGSYTALLLDAALHVSPFTFTLMEAGMGIDLAKPSDIRFYLSGFGVAFDTGELSIGGSFSKSQEGGTDVYAGTLLIKSKMFTAMAVGEYKAGSLFAYMALSASIGGPPAFFVTGIALGFGYQKKLIFPQIEEVPAYPLITAARNGFQAWILTDLQKYIQDENGQNFLVAGVQFESFQIVDGFLLLSVSFGHEFEIGVLGLADISVPPKVKTDPIAKAQLALKADYSPAKGVFSVEARLTSESYVLSRDCKLTGGFAAYFWFGGSGHEGDFVITLGGYHPAFQKPEHYPVVPRLGLNWNVNEHLNISGELYFALTPSMLMAGGRLSAVYTQGNLKAWFIAYADFLIAWKPFSYQAKIGVSLGASYRIDWWFIHKTFSIELAAELALWGPEVHGTLHVTWFIISFDISFSMGEDHSKDSLDWEGFKQSFLYNESAKNSIDGVQKDQGILSLTLDGVIGQASDGKQIVDSHTLTISVNSKIPESGNVRPVCSAPLQSNITLDVLDSSGKSVKDRLTQNKIKKSVPSALWKSAPDSGKALDEEMTKDAVCGVSLQVNADNSKMPELFPKTRYISLDELYKKNTLQYEECFCFTDDVRYSLSQKDSIEIFSKSGGSAVTEANRQAYLAKFGITQNVSITQFASQAQSWLSEDILIQSGGN